ncbi:hypothetical protein EPR50_G00183670 [Perca flavescens]|uniref:Uncharacterized protein n=1 Tax=Perca flavescens TaxID=8167 RepID=A0A484C8D8_PERFV|nr:hypothetical protein EPR50_G00183670 [Perca flavescens]
MPPTPVLSLPRTPRPALPPHSSSHSQETPRVNKAQPCYLQTWTRSTRTRSAECTTSTAPPHISTPAPRGEERRPGKASSTAAISGSIVSTQVQPESREPQLPAWSPRDTRMTTDTKRGPRAPTVARISAPQPRQELRLYAPPPPWAHHTQPVLKDSREGTVAIAVVLTTYPPQPQAQQHTWTLVVKSPATRSSSEAFPSHGRKASKSAGATPKDSGRPPPLQRNSTVLTGR